MSAASDGSGRAFGWAAAAVLIVGTAFIGYWLMKSLPTEPISRQTPDEYAGVWKVLAPALIGGLSAALVNQLFNWKMKSREFHRAHNERVREAYAKWAAAAVDQTQSATAEASIATLGDARSPQDRQRAHAESKAKWLALRSAISVVRISDVDPKRIAKFSKLNDGIWSLLPLEHGDHAERYEHVENVATKSVECLHGVNALLDEIARDLVRA